MAEITLITGGQRSGKSSYAQQQALELSDNPVYLATSRIWDADFEQRIDRHKSDRGPQWSNLEEEKNIHQVDIEDRVVVLDCITLWLTNIFHDNAYDIDKSLDEAKSIWTKFMAIKCKVLVVSNELGMSMHAETEVGRKFTDLQGWMNQFIAKSADTVVLMVSGISMKIK